MHLKSLRRLVAIVTATGALVVPSTAAAAIPLQPLPPKPVADVLIQRAFNKATRKYGVPSYQQWQVEYRKLARAWWMKRTKDPVISFDLQNRNFHLALWYASIRHRVNYRWLHQCAHSEGHVHIRRDDGAYDSFIMNYGGSGAGGWMQFMESTFTGNVDHAKVPAKFRKWRSRVGQANTAAYMFKIGQSGQWTGAGC